jgi:hypothetical protein
VIKLGRRVQLHGPNLDRDCWWRFRGSWHSGDEFGNCSLYVQLPLAGGFVWFWDPHFQDQVELPEPGTNDFIDAKRWNKDLVAFAKRRSQGR